MLVATTRLQLFNWWRRALFTSFPVQCSAAPLYPLVVVQWWFDLLTQSVPCRIFKKYFVIISNHFCIEKLNSVPKSYVSITNQSHSNVTISKVTIRVVTVVVVEDCINHQLLLLAAHVLIRNGRIILIFPSVCFTLIYWNSCTGLSTTEWIDSPTGTKTYIAHFYDAHFQLAHSSE
jgi:hypothetical protein